jgi:hypothetical protein
MLGASVVEGDWSAQVDGLSGRLRVCLEELQPGLRHAVWLELWNHGRELVAVTNQPSVDAELTTADEVPVPLTLMPTSGPLAIAQVAMIPGEAYLGFRIDMQTVGMPVREQGAALVALGGQNWLVRSGRYRLAVAIVLSGAETSSARNWCGRLDLPPIAFEVSV